MGSLTSCLKKAGTALDPEHRAAVQERTRELRAAGKSVAEAAAQAVEERITAVQAAIDGWGKNQEERAAAPVAESLAPGRTADGDGGAAPTRAGGAPDVLSEIKKAPPEPEWSVGDRASYRVLLGSGKEFGAGSGEPRSQFRHG